MLFIPQLPQDLPDEVLAQLGNRVQHALRAITPKDATAIDKTVQTYPMTEVYDLASALSSLGVGEAVVTVLSPAGVPTPVAWTRLYPPQSRRAPPAPAPIAASAIHARYGRTVDPDSAYERLTARLQQAQAEAPIPHPPRPPRAPDREPARPGPLRRRRRHQGPDPGGQAGPPLHE